MEEPNPRVASGWADRPWWILLVLLPGLWALFFRPLAPIDETRAAGVAWEMWLSRDFLVPHMNGMPYSHKPPLLFWLLNLGWAVFGVSDWWSRLVPPLVTLAATALTVRLARELWPGERRVPPAAAWLLAGSLGWMLYGQMLMYDVLLTTCVLIALLGAWRAGSNSGPGGWLLIACGIGLGILAKGPVALVHVVPVLLLGPVWSAGARRGPLAWYGKTLLGVLGGLLIAGLWALPAASLGGEDYANAILLRQTTGRVVQSFAHERPWWVYLLFMPALALPWALMPGTWRALFRKHAPDGRRFVLCWALGSLLVLSLVSGKQPHYAVPELPALVLLIAWGLSGRHTTRRIAIQAVAAVLALHTAATVALKGFDLDQVFDMKPAAALAASLQKSGVPLATSPVYKDQLAFAGRLERPVTLVPRADMDDWLRENPDGVIIAFQEILPEGLGLAVYAEFPYRRGQVQFMRRMGERNGDDQ